MTRQQLSTYFKRLVKVYLAALKTDSEKLIDTAIELGYNDFIGAVPWAFREKHTTLTTTGSQETVDLPDDFDGIISLTEHTSASGFKLQKYAVDQYDHLIPYSGGQSENTPKIYKVYYDGEEGVWQLALYPTPDSAISLYLSYQTMGDGAEIPAKYIGGLTAGIAQYLFIPGSKEWNGAHMAFLSEVERLKMADDPDAGTITKVLDASDVAPSWDFEEYVTRSGNV